MGKVGRTIYNVREILKQIFPCVTPLPLQLNDRHMSSTIVQSNEASFGVLFGKGRRLRHRAPPTRPLTFGCCELALSLVSWRRLSHESANVGLCRGGDGNVVSAALPCPGLNHCPPSGSLHSFGSNNFIVPSSSMAEHLAVARASVILLL